MKKNLLITGGSGYLGVNLAKKFKKKYRVFLGSRNQKRNREASILTGCKDIPLDVSNINSIRDAITFCNPDVIIHAAALPYKECEQDPQNAYIINNALTEILSDYCIKNNCYFSPWLNTII